MVSRLLSICVQILLKISSFSDTNHYYAEHGGAIFDGQKMSIYWADVSHEIAFIVPSRGLDDEQAKNVNNQSQTTVTSSNCSQSINSSVNNSSLGSALSSTLEDKNLQKQQLHNLQEQRSISSYSDGDTISSTSHNLSENSSQFRNNASINNSASLATNTNEINQRKKRQTLHANIGCDFKILIIWLENSEDEYNLPISNILLKQTSAIEILIGFP